MMRIFLPVIIRIAASVARKATPEIRQQLIEFVAKWEVECRKTPNKWDDIFVDIVKGVLQIKNGT